MNKNGLKVVKSDSKRSGIKGKKEVPRRSY